MSYTMFLLSLMIPFHSVLVSMDKKMEERIEERMQHYYSFTKQGSFTEVAKHIGSTNARRAFGGFLQGDDFLVETHTFLRFIKENTKQINAQEAMTKLLKCYYSIYKKAYLEPTNNNPLFLSKNIISETFSIFYENNLLTKKDENINLLYLISDPELLNILIYKNDILKNIYSIPKKNLPCKSDIIKKGLNIGVDTSIKVFNVFRKKDNALKSSSQTLMHNNPLLHSIVEKHYAPSPAPIQILFLKTMFQPYPCEKLPDCSLLPRIIQKRIVTLLLCCKKFSLKNKTVFPKPVQQMIVKKLIAYEDAARVREYLRTESILLNLNDLDGTENFKQNIKETMNFVKKDLLGWFDNEVNKL